MVVNSWRQYCCFVNLDRESIPWGLLHRCGMLGTRLICVHRRPQRSNDVNRRVRWCTTSEENPVLEIASAGSGLLLLFLINNKPSTAFPGGIKALWDKTQSLERASILVSDIEMIDPWKQTELKRWRATDTSWKRKQPLRESPDTAAMRLPRSNRKLRAVEFKGPRVSQAIIIIIFLNPVLRSWTG